MLQHIFMGVVLKLGGGPALRAAIESSGGHSKAQDITCAAW